MFAWRAHKGEVHGLAFSPDGRWLATAGAGGARVWDAAGSAARAEVPGLAAVTVAFSPDGRFAAADVAERVRGDVDVTVQVWTPPASPPVRVRPAGVAASFAFAPDGRLVVRSNIEFLLDVIEWIDPATGAVVAAWDRMPGHGRAVAVSPDGRRVAVPSYEHLVVYDAATRRPLLDVPLPAQGRLNLAYSADGRYLLCGAAGRLDVWDAGSLERLAVIDQGRLFIRGAAWTPDGRSVVTVSSAGAARVWEVATGILVREYGWGAGRLGAVAVAPDGLRAAAGTTRGRVVVWDLDP